MVTRRQFGAALAAPLLNAASSPRPNILWITCEDTGPDFPFCGDAYSVAPNLTRLAARSTTYRNAWSVAPVCAPARTSIITGCYPSALGAENMRSMIPLPAGQELFPALLRKAGYYCTNNAKEDYNVEKPEGTWDESSKNAHYSKRAAGQPFFAVFNLLETHESQIRARPHTLVHDPKGVRVPAYHPDTPEVRHDWAQYYDNITTMDVKAGRLLDELEKSGLADNTIVFFYGDHGSGMPRSKRWCYNSGLNVSITVQIPERFRQLAAKDYVPGALNNRLVSFVDLGPTVLSLAGVKPPSYMHGQPFMGAHEAPRRQFLHGLRGRMDERYDAIRSVRDERYVYIRNYMPHKIYGQYLAYMWETPTTQVWERLYKEGKLTPAQRRFWEKKPFEELYDLQTDRDEVQNLVAEPAHAAALARLRQAHREHTARIHDVGLLSEDEVHSRALAEVDTGRLAEAAEFAASATKTAGRLERMLSSPDSGVRYWGALGVLIRGEAEVRRMRPQLEKALTDKARAVRIVAAEALARYGMEEDLRPAMEALVPLCDARDHGAYVAMQALNAFDSIGAKAKPWATQILAMPKADPDAPERVRTEYIQRLQEHIRSSV